MQGDYWEAELDLPGASEPLTVIVPAPEAGPTDGQVTLCRRLLGDLDRLFGRCRPLFEGEFQTWTGRALPSDWNEEFSLTGLDLPEESDLSRPWEVRTSAGLPPSLPLAPASFLSQPASSESPRAQALTKSINLSSAHLPLLSNFVALVAAGSPKNDEAPFFSQ